MTLNECTKEELISIINRLAHFDKSQLGRYLNNIEYERVQKKLKEADNWLKVANLSRQKYSEIIRELKEKPLFDVPIDLVNKATRCLEDAEKADKEWQKLMKEVDKYGGKAVMLLDKEGV